MVNNKMVNIKKTLDRDNLITEEDIKNNQEKINSFYNNSKILILGAAGSIGSAFTKEIIKYNPQSLFLVDYDENGLVDLLRFIRSEDYQKINIELYPLGYETSLFKDIILNNSFDCIYNFTARKHVRSESNIESSFQIIKTNILDFYDLLTNLQNSQKIFSVSTDKAAYPVNIMGASKRIMEDIIHSSHNVKGSTARFGNVAFSKGSLLNSFEQRIENGQPIPIPKNVYRYFLTEKEAASICILSSTLNIEKPTLIPKPGLLKPITIEDIAINYLKQTNREFKFYVNDDEYNNERNELSRNIVPLIFDQLNTTGEKDKEVFYEEDEKVTETSYKNFYNLENKSLGIDYQNFIEELKTLMQRPEKTKEEIIRILKDCIETFNHLDSGFSLNEKK